MSNAPPAIEFNLTIPPGPDVAILWVQLMVKITDRLLNNTMPPGTEMQARWERGDWQIRCIQHVTEPIVLVGTTGTDELVGAEE